MHVGSGRGSPVRGSALWRRYGFSLGREGAGDLAWLGLPRLEVRVEVYIIIQSVAQSESVGGVATLPGI